MNQSDELADCFEGLTDTRLHNVSMYKADIGDRKLVHFFSSVIKLGCGGETFRPISLLLLIL